MDSFCWSSFFEDGFDEIRVTFNRSASLLAHDIDAPREVLAAYTDASRLYAYTPGVRARFMAV